MTEIGAPGPGRPSFILFVTDQHRADHLGCYGHPVLRTPHIDTIAARGVAFDELHVASPVCMPNRASLMTGRMPSAHGVRANGIPLSRRAVTFVDLLRDAGYATALVGKAHLQNFTGRPPLGDEAEVPPGVHRPGEELAAAMRDDLTGPDYRYEDPGFWAGPAPRVETPFYGFDHVELVTGHGDHVGGDYAAWLRERDPDAARMIGAGNQLPHDYACPQAVRTALPEALYHTSYIAERGEARLRALAADPQPFFLMVSFPDPHHPFNPPGRYWDLYRPADMPVPEAFTRNDWTPPPHVQAVIDARARGTARLGGMNSVAVELREALEARALTCGMIAMIDDAVGRVLAALEDVGRGGDTVLAFTADHGDHLGDHRLLLKGAEQYRALTCVPFLWADPRAGTGGTRTDALASTIDIAATVLERAAIAPFAGMQGRSLLQVIEGRANAVRDAVLVQYEHQRAHVGLGGPPRVHSIVERDWRLSLFDGVAWGELYDLRNDPGEFVNLWDDPASAADKARLMEALARAEVAAVDRVPLPTGIA